MMDFAARCPAGGVGPVSQCDKSALLALDAFPSTPLHCHKTLCVTERREPQFRDRPEIMTKG